MERLGGFRNLRYDARAVFTSALAVNASVEWSVAYANVSGSSHNQTRALLSVSFPAIDWGFLQSVYGWPALQYQLWARGLLEIKGAESQTVAISSGGLLEFWLDGEQYFGGDLYYYHRAPDLLQLSPGHHVLDLRLTRDVRALGGLSNSVEVVLEAEIRDDLITLDQGSLLVSEMTKGRLGGIWASINVQNNAVDWAEVTSMQASKVSFSSFNVLRALF